MKNSFSCSSQKFERLTLRVDECASILGIGRSAAYALVRNAEATGGNPFRVMRIGTSLLVSKKSFAAYLEANGL